MKNSFENFPSGLGRVKEQIKKVLVTAGVVVMASSLSAKDTSVVGNPENFAQTNTKNFSPRERSFSDSAVAKKADEFESEQNQEEVLEGGGGDPESGPTLRIDINFNTQTTEVSNPDQLVEATKQIENFLKDFDPKTTKIKITGNYSIERPYIGNDELANKRADIGKQLLISILSKKGIDLRDVNIEMESGGMSVLDLFTQAQLDNMTAQEIETAKNACQNFTLALEMINPPKSQERPVRPSQPERAPESFETGSWGNVLGLIVDRSPSMQDNLRQTVASLEYFESRNRNAQIEVVNMEGSNTGIEAPLSSVLNFLRRIDRQDHERELVVILDEADNSVYVKNSRNPQLIDSFNSELHDSLVRQILDLASQKNIKILIKVFSPQNPNQSKIVNFALKPDALKIPFSGAGTREEEAQRAWFNGL